MVRANTVEEAVSTAETEADLLAALLSLHRNGYGSLFATVILDKVGGKLGYRFIHQPYTGNLMGGQISGEDPIAITRHMASLRASAPAQLYIALLREAMRERDSEFRCFRLWNLLETIARAKNYIGQPMIDSAGKVIRNRKGQDRLVTNHAEQLVLQLLRSVLLPRGLSETTYGHVLQQGALSQQVPIWYRRRNCVTHGGACLCRNPNLALTETKFLNCKRARDEVTAPGRDDGYLRTLRDVTVAVVGAELD
jgi:hypothetical protein